MLNFLNASMRLRYISTVNLKRFMNLLRVLLIFFFTNCLLARVLDCKELTTNQVRNIDKSKAVVIISGWLLEEHGPYLPLYTDGYTNEALSKRIADSVYSVSKLPILIFPTIPLGVGSPEAY